MSRRKDKMIREKMVSKEENGVVEESQNKHMRMTHDAPVMTRRPFRTKSKPESKRFRIQKPEFPVSDFRFRLGVTCCRSLPWRLPISGFFLIFPHFPHFSHFSSFFFIFSHFFTILGCSWRPLGSSGRGLLCRVASSSVGLGAVLPSAVWPCLQPILCRHLCPW